jgi:hypothetical protein
MKNSLIFLFYIFIGISANQFLTHPGKKPSFKNNRNIEPKQRAHSPPKVRRGGLMAGLAS